MLNVGKFICFILLNLLTLTCFSQSGVVETKDYKYHEHAILNDLDDYFEGYAIYSIADSSDAKIQAGISYGEGYSDTHYYIKDGKFTMIYDTFYQLPEDIETMRRVWIVKPNGDLQFVSGNPPSDLDRKKTILMARHLISVFRLFEIPIQGNLR